MSYWLHLPSELWYKIFQLLPRQDIMECQLTCQLWHKVSKRAAYNKITVYEDHQVPLLIDTFANSSFVPGHFVRHLDLPCEDSQRWDLDSVLVQIANHCPYVESITLSKTCALFYNRIAQELQKGNLSYLDKLQFPQVDGKELESYTNVIMLMHDRLKKIKISDCVSSSFFTKTYRPLTDKVKDFKQVERLVLEKFREWSLNELNALVDSLEELKYLRLILHLSSPLDTYKDTVLKPKTKVRKLYINRIIGLENAFVYIMNKFPCLEHLEIDKANHDRPILLSITRQSNFDPSIMKQLIFYLKNLKSFSIKKLENMLEFAFLLRKELTVGRLGIKLLFDIEPDDVKFYLNLFYHRDLPSTDSTIHLHISNKNRSIDLSPILEAFGPIINELTIRYGGEGPVDKCDIENILNNCPKLQQLNLKNLQLIECNAGGECNESLKMLTLVKCVYTPSALTTLSYRLPYLHRMEMIKSTLINQANSHTHLYMPGTTLKLFQLERISLRNIDTFVYLHLRTRDAETHYRLDGLTSTSVTAEEYQAFVSNDQVLTLDIKCNKIECLNVIDWQFYIVFHIQD
ncbi:uncharacterized protein B0P05DRAFT_563206 [Gilbertella persicaria]|uniref:uncharacterized protein n=1 Tax=Gilbertella persicaria TaxID=101096 RepID=UPI00221F6329|nr:uncharacterized protein B0P05DRAFT_563206 [Gilbertella persicaria]KAI8050132.1 hypothetical protein B0P05DRAFT_563206 [Gilbertella persicaria]